MDKLVTAAVIAIAFGAFAAPVLAMTDSEYQSQRQRMREDFSHRFVNCVQFSGRERSRCESDLRSERDASLKALAQNYKASREPNGVRP